MTNRIGFRHVFGVLIPNFNSVVEPELASLQLPGVINQTARFVLDAEVIEHIGESAEGLVASGVQSWIVGLATEGFPDGLALLDRGVEMLRTRTGLPVHTASYAVHAALEFLGARRVGIVTPFDDATNEHVRASYEARGFEVAAMAGLARPSIEEIANTPDDETARAFESVSSTDLDALVQVGTGLPMLHQIETLERRFGLPIVASNPAAYWQGLRAAGIKDRIPAAGHLFSMDG